MKKIHLLSSLLLLLAATFSLISCDNNDSDKPQKTDKLTFFEAQANYVGSLKVLNKVAVANDYTVWFSTKGNKASLSMQNFPAFGGMEITGLHFEDIQLSVKDQTIVLNANETLKDVWMGKQNLSNTTAQLTGSIVNGKMNISIHWAAGGPHDVVIELDANKITLPNSPSLANLMGTYHGDLNPIMKGKPLPTQLNYDVTFQLDDNGKTATATFSPITAMGKMQVAGVVVKNIQFKSTSKGYDFVANEQVNSGGSMGNLTFNNRVKFAGSISKSGLLTGRLAWYPTDIQGEMKFPLDTDILFDLHTGFLK